MLLLKNNLQIAIDGPVAAGKSNVARLVAKRLGIIYVYTGAMYRSVGLLAMKNNIDFSEEEALVDLFKSVDFQLLPSENERPCKVCIDGVDVTEELFTPKASQASSKVAVLPKIRELLVARQQLIAKNHSVVMEGRDICDIVLPNADLKIYMDANIDIRSRRRFQDLLKDGFRTSYEDVVKDTLERDFQDTHRNVNPLQKSKDAWVLDTTELSIDEVIDAICQKLVKMKLIQL